jgi:SulP family sulfate permease
MAESRLTRLRRDASAGATTALVTIPDGMASALLAGLNPVHGLYALMVGTPIAALVASSHFMYVANTGAIAVATGSVLADFSGDAKVQAMITLTLLVGVFQLLLGLLRASAILRYVSNAVLTGFLAGIAVRIILSQLPELTAYHAEGHVLARAWQVVTGIGAWNLHATMLGVLTIGLIVVVERTRARNLSMIAGLAGAMAAMFALGWHDVPKVADIAQIPSGLPVPDLSKLVFTADIVLGALAVGAIALVQGAAVSRTIPNPDGRYPDVARDFAAQGVSNIAAGLFKGMPIGGTMSETAVNVSAGAQTRWAIVFSGVFIIAAVLLFGDWVEQVMLTSIAALLIVAAVQAIDPVRIADVWDVSWGARLTMLATFAATLAIPVTYSVLLGMALSALLYLYRASTDLRVVEVVPQVGGLLKEQAAPSALTDNAMTILDAHGSIFFASIDALEARLPQPETARNAVVILRLRNRSSVGSSFVRMLKHYARRLEKSGNLLMLSGAAPEVIEQLRRTEVTDVIAERHIFPATEIIGEALQSARAAAQNWIDQHRT